jgi:GntR family transcriptional regulator/MocR family aminotransferase
LIDAFVRARALCDGHPPTLPQAVLADFLSEGYFALHLRRMRRLYAERQEVFVRAASRDLKGLLEVPSCDGGMHLIGWLAAGIDDRAVARRVKAGGIVTMPLSSLASRPLTRGALLLGYTGIDARTIREGVSRLAGILGKSV